ncbi:MAG: hypothetical protein AAFQ61_08345 [Cyanobacteria bacterium J06626_23]
MVILIATPAQAQLRQTHPASAAIEGSVRVTVWAGSGTNIDFSDLGESVYRIWLDDPSRITVDTDNDLLDGGGAQVIHLRRIEGVDFEGLPATAQTLLTVATVNQARQTTLYQFPVFYSTGVPDYSTIALTLPPAPIAPEPLVQVTGTPGGATLETVQLGLAVSIQEGTIAAGGPLAERVKTFLSLVRNGSTPAEAAIAAEIDIRVIEELASRGLAEEAASREARLLDRVEASDDSPTLVPLPGLEEAEAAPERMLPLFDLNPANILPDGDVLRLNP